MMGKIMIIMKVKQIVSACRWKADYKFRTLFLENIKFYLASSFDIQAVRILLEALKCSSVVPILISVSTSSDNLGIPKS